MKRLPIILVLFFCLHTGAMAQSIIINPDGTHSLATGNIIVNPDGTHSVVSGNVIVNPDGTHSLISGNIIINPDGTHSIRQGNFIINLNGKNSTAACNTTCGDRAKNDNDPAALSKMIRKRFDRDDIDTVKLTKAERHKIKRAERTAKREDRITKRMEARNSVR